jgi:hypothetical protein
MLSSIREPFGSILILHSMILLEINVEGITSCKFESDAPRPVHMNGVANGVEAGEWVEVVSRHVYFGDLHRFIDRIKTNAYALVHSLINSGRLPGLEQIGQGFTPERLDHIDM